MAESRSGTDRKSLAEMEVSFITENEIFDRIQEAMIKISNKEIKKASFSIR